MPSFPPFLPLPAGSAIVQKAASVVTVNLQLAGDISTFSAAAQDALKASLRTSLSCQEPACYLELRLRAGSIDADVVLTLPQDSAASPAASLGQVQSAATALVTSPPAAISSALGVSVASASPTVGTQTNVVVPLVLAPPPPTPPTPPSPPLPTAPTPSAPAGAASPTLPRPPLTDEEALTDEQEDGQAGFMRMVIIACCLLFGTCLMLGLFFYFLHYRQKKEDRRAELAASQGGGRGKPWSSVVAVEGIIDMQNRSKQNTPRPPPAMDDLQAWSNAMANGQFDEASGGIRIGQSALV